MSFGQRISSFFGRVDRQACFNIGMSFLAFSFAGQVYQAKLNRLGLEQEIAQMTGALTKMDRVIVDESKSAEALRKSIRDLLKEARGRTEELSAEEATAAFAVNDTDPKKGKIVI